MKMAVGPSAIRVNAVLSAFRDDESSDVVDALCYFFVPILDKVAGNPMTGSFIAKAGGLVYGWNLTESVGEVFLERLVAHGFVTVEGSGKDKRYIAQASPEMSSNIDETIQQAFDEVTERFEKFELIANDLINRNLTKEELGDMLVRFLISLDAYTNESIALELKAPAKNGELAALKELESDVSVLSRAETHVCARFVQQLSKEEPELSENLGLFVSAGLLAELVEDFRKPSTVETKSETIFFLDGPMLLGLIGTSGEALQAEARTIVDALKSIGCRVQTLSESCREAERVLSAYMKASPSDRHGRTHTAVMSGEVDRNFVQTVLADVEAAAVRFGVDVREYQLEKFPNQHKYFDRERNLDVDSYLGWPNPLAREHDAFAVTAIMRMRQGSHKNDPLDNSHVFISSNARLVRKAREYCIKSQLIRETQCGPVVDTRDLATIAWLRTGFENSKKLPISHMLAQCERVLRVRKDVVDSAREQVAKFTPEKKEQFELLLQNNRAVSFLMDSAGGSSTTFDVDRDQHLLDGMLDAAIKVVKDDTERQLIEKDAAIKDLRQKTRDEKAAIKKELKGENAALDAEKVALLAQLKEVEDRETAARRELAKVGTGYQSIMLKGQSRVNLWINVVQIIAGLVLVFLAASTAFTILGDEPPTWANYGARALGLYGIVTAIQALRGRSLLGLAHLSRWLGRTAFLGYSTKRGVPIDVARDRLLIEDGRVYLRSVSEKVLLESDG
ncbi:MAG: hypothetical protein ABJL99_21060 [Aliishimia sp.]